MVCGEKNSLFWLGLENGRNNKKEKKWEDSVVRELRKKIL